MDLKAGLDGVGADGLGKMAFTQTGRANQERVAVLADELPGGQLVDGLALDGWIEGPVEVFEGFVGIAKAGVALALVDQALLANVDFILGGRQHHKAMPHRSRRRLPSAAWPAKRRRRQTKST